MLISRIRKGLIPESVTIHYYDGRAQMFMVSALTLNFRGIPYTIPPRRDAIARAVCHTTEAGIDWIQISGNYTTFRTADNIQVRFHLDDGGTDYLFQRGSPEYSNYLRDSSPSNLHHHQCGCKKVWLCSSSSICRTRPHKKCASCILRELQREWAHGGTVSQSANYPVQAAQSDLEAMAERPRGERIVRWIDEAGDDLSWDTETIDNTQYIGLTNVNSADQGTSELRNPAGEREDTPHSSEWVHTTGLAGLYRRG